MAGTTVTAVAKQPSTKAMAVKSFQDVMNNNYYQSLLQNTLRENKGTFCTSLMELFSSDEKLMQCKPTDLMAEALKAASLHLPLNKQLGQCYILPFKNKGIMTPTLVVGTRGYLQLAMRTGKYETINSDVVYEGELTGYDKVTGRLDLSGVRSSNVPVGYFAYFRMKNGLSKLLYMTLDEVCIYAKQYSPTVKFSEKTTAESLKKLALKQAAEGSGDGVGWYSNFESMALKTVLRRLLSKWGELSIESNDIINLDEAPAVSSANERDVQFAEAKEVSAVDTATGEIVQPGDEVSQTQSVNPNPFKLS
ncbi:MAG: recombinase RecT [Prevotella sp.]|nr:recombinase RecT [Prevotella sp.]